MQAFAARGSRALAAGVTAAVRAVRYGVLAHIVAYNCSAAPDAHAAIGTRFLVIGALISSCPALADGVLEKMLKATPAFVNIFLRKYLDGVCVPLGPSGLDQPGPWS